MVLRELLVAAEALDIGHKGQIPHDQGRLLAQAADRLGQMKFCFRGPEGGVLDALSIEPGGESVEFFGPEVLDGRPCRRNRSQGILASSRQKVEHAKPGVLGHLIGRAGAGDHVPLQSPDGPFEFGLPIVDAVVGIRSPLDGACFLARRLRLLSVVCFRGSSVAAFNAIGDFVRL